MKREYDLRGGVRGKYYRLYIESSPHVYHITSANSLEEGPRLSRWQQILSYLRVLWS